MKWVNANEAYSRSTAMLRFDELMAESSIDYLAIMDEAGLPRAALKNPNLFISQERFGIFLERVSQASGETNLSLKYALMMAPDFQNFGSLFQIAQFCGSVRDWVDRASRLVWLQTNGWLPHLKEQPDGLASFRLIEGPVRRMPRQLSEGVMASLFLLVRELADNHSMTPHSVHFRHEAPDDQSFHREVFQCDVQFGCRHHEFIFDASFLDQPITGNLAKFQSIFDIYVRVQLGQLVRREITIRSAVFAAVSTLTGTELCTASKVAELLGMSEKKMQRLLRAEGTNFRDEVQKARESLAMDMLARTQLPINEIARVLGYGSGTAFSLAFSKLVGQTPSQFRTSKRQDKDGV